MKKLLFIIFFSELFCLSVNAQQYIPLDNSYYNKLYQYSISHKTPFFSSLKPLTTQELDESFNLNEILYDESKMAGYSDKYIWRKLFKENFIKWEKGNYRVTINPLFNFEVGREFKDGKNTWVNTRAVSVSGNITPKLFFNSEIYENQAVLPNWLDEFSREQKVIPGQGGYKFYKNGKGFDFSSSSGYVSYNPIKEINFTLGYGKNFIGDGYRSLLLSDIGFSYPYLRVSAQVNKFKYTALYAQMTEKDDFGADNRAFGFDRKWITMHYAQVMLWDRLELGLWDAVVFENSDTLKNRRGFDVAYLNPVIFLRPQEFAIGSPDNMLIGATFNLRINNMFNTYGQLLLDEFKAKELFSSSGWWANKYGIQLGVAGWNLFKVNNLHARLEYNQVRPYTYSHWASIQGYSHYAQPLAHPLGANFREGIAMASYKKENWIIKAKVNIAQYGLDTNKTSFGKDVFKSYDLRPEDYNHKIGQGLKTDLIMTDFSIAYLLNRYTNMRFELGIITRNEKNTKFTKESAFVYFGFKTGLRNLYYDF